MKKILTGIGITKEFLAAFGLQDENVNRLSFRAITSSGLIESADAGSVEMTLTSPPPHYTERTFIVSHHDTPVLNLFIEALGFKDWLVNSLSVHIAFDEVASAELNVTVNVVVEEGFLNLENRVFKVREIT